MMGWNGMGWDGKVRRAGNGRKGLVRLGQQTWHGSQTLKQARRSHFHSPKKVPTYLTDRSRSLAPSVRWYIGYVGAAGSDQPRFSHTPSP